MDRKQFITASGLLGMASILKALPAIAQNADSLKVNPIKKIITIEEHFILKNIYQKVGAFNAKKNGGPPANASVQKELYALVMPTFDDIADIGERRIKFMNESGIDMQVLSYGPGSPQNITDKTLALELCQEANNELANSIKLYPTRFSGFALLPLADPNAAVLEFERTVKQFGFKGAMLSGTFNGRFFDEPEFFPIFAKAQELDVPMYIHPAFIEKMVADYYYQSENWSPVASAMFASAGYGWHLDSGISLLRLIASGILDKLPNLKLISGHWGELTVFFLNRLDDMLSISLKLNRKISDYYKSNIFITPSGMFSENQLKYAIAEVGADNIIYSGDYPFLIDKSTKGFLEKADISKEDKDKIAHKNAEKLLGL